MSEDMPEDMPDRVPEDMPEHMPGRMPEDMPDRMTEDMPDKIPGDMPEDMPDRMPEGMPDRMSHRMPEGMSGRMPEDMPDRMPEDMPDKMPEDMPEDMPDRMPEGMPDRMSNRMPEGMPDKVPECLPDRMPADLPDRMPDRMSEGMPEAMPDRMPDRMPEDMSDRMPEDLPVTKRINVMVGTGMTRSKVMQSKGMVKRHEVTKVQIMMELKSSQTLRVEWTLEAPSKTPSFCTITEKRFMSAVTHSRGQFVSSHFDGSSYTIQGKNNLANLTKPFSSPGQVISKAISCQWLFRNANLMWAKDLGTERLFEFCTNKRSYSTHYFQHPRHVRQIDQLLYRHYINNYSLESARYVWLDMKGPFVRINDHWRLWVNVSQHVYGCLFKESVGAAEVICWTSNLRMWLRWKVSNHSGYAFNTLFWRSNLEPHLEGTLLLSLVTGTMSIWM